LLVVAASDLEDVALKLIANAVARNLCPHPVIISCCNFDIRGCIRTACP
jgi:hypothetical protein